MKNNILKSYLIVSLFAVCVSAQSIVPTPPELNLSSYILMDATTGKILAESNSNSQIEPASMTKVMTGYIVACLLYTSPSPRDATLSRMPSSA